MIGLTETWLKTDEYTGLNEASPPGYTSDQISTKLGVFQRALKDSTVQYEKAYNAARSTYLHNLRRIKHDSK